ncbi:MAG: flagellar hook protein [Methylobacterium sp.]|jgi:flagellin-like hook-associated protein FlgL|uniref:flagellin N-terminal helical domain-containing protein n=1 Tax=Methylobacterium sp. TaxID=409 RepID=UPI00271FB6C0|nr:flagellar hook protein [Methylobacterium sp.]MDO9426467.1 flagellar hook protein [Methylobacterium sp.]
MSSGITLSAATRQNLLSLQGTADLLSTTQNRLSTGKKVNSALDSPVNFFTAQSLNSRSSGISSLLDGISNGIQTIQAASKGITSLTKLTDQLKSTAQQALSATSAFTAKASLTSKALNGAVDTNLLSTGPTEALGAVPSLVGAGAAQVTTGAVTTLDDPTILALTGSKTLKVDGVDLNLDFDGTITNQTTLLNSINTQLTAGGSAVQATFATNTLVLSGTATSGKFVVGASQGATDLLGAATSTVASVTAANVTGSTKATALGFADGDSFSVNGASVSVSKTDTLDTLAQKVVSATKGDVSATFDPTADKFTFKAKDAKTAVNLANGSTATSLVANLGYGTTSQFAAGKGANGSTADLNNKVLSVTVGSGATAKTTALTFGTGAGQISTLDQLNDALGSANAQASIDGTGKLSISTNNDAGSQQLTLGGSATGGANSFLTTAATATIGGDGLTARNKLVTDYNNLLTQIDQLSNDSSFNGVNLLKGDQLKVSFNEAQSSSITVQGKATSSDTLGLKAVTTDNFKDNASINDVFSSIRSAANNLQSQSATYASNLSVVQNRQDFSKNLISVLDTGSANLTNADLNEEAANSQALSTRNSLAISALGLANTAQQGILQLLR